MAREHANGLSADDIHSGRAQVGFSEQRVIRALGGDAQASCTTRSTQCRPYSSTLPIYVLHGTTHRRHQKTRKARGERECKTEELGTVRC